MTIPTPNKSLTLPSGTQYTYIHHPPNSSKPTLLFLHGFPSTSHDWRHQITHFQSLGYGILAPDLLGYGGSSKPLTPESYLGSTMSSDIISILSHENINEKVIGIAHDWGTYLLSQLAFRYPSRFERFVFLSVPFSPPGVKFDVKGINEVTKKMKGFEQFGYQVFLGGDDEAGRILGENWEGLFSIVYADDPAIWKTCLAPIGALKNWLETKSLTKVAGYIAEEDKEYHHRVFGGDYSAPCMWYKRALMSLGLEEEKLMLERGEIENGGKIEKETLLLTGLKDVVCDAGMAGSSMKGNVEDGKLKVVDMDTGHWIMLEKAEETNKELEQFFEEGVNVKSVL